MAKPRVDVRIKNESWQRDLQEAAMNTINRKWNQGKPLTEDLFMRYILSEHSPIRAVEIRVTMYDIPYATHVHFARHVHSIPYVTTNRPDRTGKPRNLEDKCTHIFDINIQGLIDMARKRLCIGKCEKNTYEYMKAIKDWFTERGGNYKVIGEMLVPNCVYRGGCPEFVPCGFFKENKILERYAEYNEKVKK